MKPSRNVSLTGIKPTGVPHLGNYMGAIAPALSLAAESEAYYFIADLHALSSVGDPASLRKDIRAVAATWLACGLDPISVTFYRQSDIPEITDLYWILSCVTPKGLMNRAHAYKAAIAVNRQSGTEDHDRGINMGLFTYPVLMAADILAMSASVVPVGSDQIQHVEYARDIALRFNHLYEPKDILVIPEAKTNTAEGLPSLPGTDGRKMSKSYGNTVPLFESVDLLRRAIFGIKTDSSGISQPKDPSASPLFAIYCSVAQLGDQERLRQRMLTGNIGWADIKKQVFEELDAFLSSKRAIYEHYMSDQAELEAILSLGASKARQRAASVLRRVREAVGLAWSTR